MYIYIYIHTNAPQKESKSYSYSYVHRNWLFFFWITTRMYIQLIIIIYISPFPMTKNKQVSSVQILVGIPSSERDHPQYVRFAAEALPKSQQGSWRRNPCKISIKSPLNTRYDHIMIIFEHCSKKKYKFSISTKLARSSRVIPPESTASHRFICEATSATNPEQSRNSLR